MIVFKEMTPEQLENLLYDRYAKLVLASKRAGLPYPTWLEYLKEWSTDNDD
jgi:hypothetical protein